MPSVYLLTAYLIDQSFWQCTIHHYVTSAHPGFPAPVVQVTLHTTWNLEVNKSYHSSSPQTCVTHFSMQHSLQVCETKFYVPMPSTKNPPCWHFLASHHNEHVCCCSNIKHGHTSLLLYQAIDKRHTTVCRSDQWPATVPACKMYNILTYTIHLQHLSHRPLMAGNRPVPPSCHVPGMWSLHKAPHKSTFSDRIRFIAETVSTTKPFMHTSSCTPSGQDMQIHNGCFHTAYRVPLPHATNFTG